MLEIDNKDHCANFVYFKKKRSALAHTVLWNYKYLHSHYINAQVGINGRFLGN